MSSTFSGPRLFAAAAALVLAIVLLGLFVALKPPRPMQKPVIRVIAISPSGHRLAAGTSRGFVYSCESVELKDCRTFEADGSLNDLRFSEIGELAIADKNIRLSKLDGASPTLVRDDDANYGSVRFAPGGRRILTIDGKGTVMTIDLDTGHASVAYCCSSIWGDVEFVDQERGAVWAGHWPGVWDFAAGRLVGRLTAARETMTFGPIAVDSAEGSIYMGSQDGRVYQWSLATRELLAKSNPLSNYVMTVSVLGTSGWVAYASRPGEVHLWNPKAGVHRLVPGARGSSNIVFDRQRGLAAFGTESGTVEFWDFIEGRLVEMKAFSDWR